MAHNFQIAVQLLASLLWIAGCSETVPATPSPEAPISVELVTDAAPADGPQVDATTHTLNGAVTGIESAGWYVFAGTDQGVLLLDDLDGASALSVNDGILNDGIPSEGSESLAVVAMTANSETVMLATSSGLVHSQGSLLLTSPMSGVLSELIIEDIAFGSDGELWIAASDGLFRAGPSETISVDYPGDEPPAHVAYQGGEVLVAGSSTAHLIDLESWQVHSLGLTGTVIDVGSHDEGFMLGCEDGLVLNSEGTWLRYPVGDDGGTRVSAVTGQENRVVAATAVGIVEWSDGILTRLSHEADLGAVEHITVDLHGHVWTSQGTQATHWRTGSPPSFEENVKPYFASSCDWCHTTGAQGVPQRDFKNYDIVVALIEPIIERIALGSMPPPTVNMPITEEEMDLLARWIDGGLQP